jgi:Zn ribbon nucleic-acid-binding protein
LELDGSQNRGISSTTMPKSRTSPADTYEAFATDEPFKSVAKRLGVSPNTLRKWWVERFGQDPFTARGKRLQAEAAVEAGRGRAGQTHRLREVEEPCAACGSPVLVNLLQKARLLRVLCETCSDLERGVDRRCPVCGVGCVGAKGLSGHFHQKSQDAAHQAYSLEEERGLWEGKVEGEDYVRCLVCGHRGVRIDLHIQAEHGLGLEEYRDRFPGSLITARALREVRATSARNQPSRAGLTKEVTCPSCLDPHLVALTSSVKDSRCPECRAKDEDDYWSSKIEGREYVTCLVCGYRTEDSLVSHIRNSHPELERVYKETFPGARVVSFESSLRDRSHLKGKPLKEETKSKMSVNAGRWNKGLTKETDERVAQAALNMVGRKSWGKGATKDSHPGVLSTSVKMRELRLVRHWTNGNEVNLTRDQLLPFARKNGKISVGKAIASLGHAFVTIRRECEKHGLAISNTAVLQSICLETLSQVLGGAPYETEWHESRFTNPTTGRRFRFDGYFPSHNLVVEFHGYQHWTFPSTYIEDEDQYAALQERDRIKENLIHSDPTLRYFLVREDEPYADPDYLRGRLIDEGIFDPGK